MIIEYHRPETLDQAKKLLNRATPVTIPLGGGSALSRHTDQPVAVVDLQSLGLDKISQEKSTAKLGAMVRWQTLVDATGLPEGLRNAAHREAGANIRRSATIGGLLMRADGRSSLLGCLLALDARIFWEPGNKSNYLADWLQNDRQKKPGNLVTSIEFTTPVEIAYEDVARSPEDRPIVYVAVARWETGETRVVMGGSGKTPILGSDGSKNLISSIFDRHSYASAMEKAGFSDYQQAAIQNLIERMVPQKGLFGRKGDK